MNPFPGAQWHAIDEQDVLSRLSASASGLTAAEAQKRLQQCGPNRLPDPVKPGRFQRFLAQFQNLLIYVLLGAAVITGVLGYFVDMGVILAVVLVNALIGYLQEGRAEQAMAAISGLLAQRAAVLRDGHRHTLPVEQLVPGDIVLLEAGDKVPADLRLLKAHDLKIQEAILTGESVAVEKQTSPVAAGAALGDRRCLAFSGTSVIHGQGMGVVVATGTGTEIGRISGLLAGVERLVTPLVSQMAVFARWLTLFILVHGCCWIVGRGNSGRAAGGTDHHPGGGGTGHGKTQCHCPPAASHRNPGCGIRDLLRQDRNPDPQRNECGHPGLVGPVAVSGR